MHRIMFHLGGLTVYSYGVFLALAFIAATIAAVVRFRQKYRNPDVILDLVLAAVVGGVIGARIAYIIGHWSYYMSHKGEIFKFNIDGLVFYGGLILGLGLALLVGRLRHLKFWITLDLAGLCVPIAIAIGRIGCLLNGCCYGKRVSWGIAYPASSGIIGPRHPTQIYELILDLALFCLLWWKKDSFERDGMTFWYFVLGYSTIRFSMEFLREHSTASANLTFQLISIGMFVLAGLIILFRYRLLPSASSRNNMLY